MNLAFIASKEVITYEGCKFTTLQNILYEELRDAIINETTFVIPSYALARQCGKSTVIEKLAEEFDLPLLRSGSSTRFSAFIDGSDGITVLVDEYINDSQFQRWTSGLPIGAVIGIAGITVPDNGNVKKVIERINREKNWNDRIIGEELSYVRQNTEPINQRIYGDFFDGIRPIEAPFSQIWESR